MLIAFAGIQHGILYVFSIYSLLNRLNNADPREEIDEL